MSRLTLPFHTRGQDGRLVINMRVNDDPYATGHDQVARNFDAAAFTGFPVLTAEVDFPSEGPAGWFGWGYRRFHDDRTDLLDPARADDEAWPRIQHRVEQDFPSWTTDPGS